MGRYKYPMRVVPWWTDEAVRFMANLFKWYPQAIDKRLRILEVGGGNSSLFLLSKGAQVTTLECSEAYANSVKNMAETGGFSVGFVDTIPEKPTNFDLTIVRLDPYDTARFAAGHWYEQSGIEKQQCNFDILVSDGIERLAFLNKFRTCTNAILVLDNCENAANWGRLTKAAAKPDHVAGYRVFLRDNSWNKILFEQPEGREGRSAPDNVGWESKHRWLTTIAWHHTHVLNRLMVSQMGLPLVNMDGLDNTDIASLESRLQSETNTAKALDMGLKRKFD